MGNYIAAENDYKNGHRIWGTADLVFAALDETGGGEAEAGARIAANALEDAEKAEAAANAAKGAEAENAAKAAEDTPRQAGGDEPTQQQQEQGKPSRKSGKERANDVPSWAKGNRPKAGENGNAFAKRLMDQKYGPGNYSTGSDSEFNRIKKWGDRGF